MIPVLFPEQVISKFKRLIGSGDNFHLYIAAESGTVTTVSKNNRPLVLTNSWHQELINVPGFEAGDEGPERAADNCLAGQVGGLVFLGKTQPVVVDINNQVILINGVNEDRTSTWVSTFFVISDSRCSSISILLEWQCRWKKWVHFL